jgi:amino acid permease
VHGHRAHLQVTAQVSTKVRLIFDVVAGTGALHVWNPEGLLVAFPVIVYSFTAHPYYLGIYSNMRTPSPSRMTRVTDLVSTGAGITEEALTRCLVLGASHAGIGTLQQPERVQSNFPEDC